MRKVNFAVNSGVVVEKNNEYGTFEVTRDSGRKDVFRVWNLPESVNAGDLVTITGKLKCGPIGNQNTKIILGVDVKTVSEELINSFVMVSGTIMAKGGVNTSRTGILFLEMTIKADDNTFVPVVMWNESAVYVDRNYKVGDMVKVEGFLQSRDYNKVKDGSKIRKTTTEVSGYYIYKYS